MRKIILASTLAMLSMVASAQTSFAPQHTQQATVLSKGESVSKFKRVLPSEKTLSEVQLNATEGKALPIAIAVGIQLILREAAKNVVRNTVVGAATGAAQDLANGGDFSIKNTACAAVGGALSSPIRSNSAGPIAGAVGAGACERFK